MSMEEKIDSILLNGYEAALRGAYEANASFLSSLKRRPSFRIKNDFGINVDKYYSSESALSLAFGAALSGKRAFCMIDEIPSDVLACYSLCGINGALVILYIEDNEYIKWDSRLIFKSAHYPILEPFDAASIKRFVKIAFNMSEKYDVPVVVRTSKALLSSLSLVDIYQPKIIKDRAYKKDASKYVLLPSTISLCEDDVIERDRRLKKDGETFPIHTVKEGGNIGVIAAGEDAELALSGLKDASVLKLGSTNPLPINMIKEFASKVGKLYCIESRPFIELELIKNDIRCIGVGLFPREGRKTVADIESWIGRSDFATDKGLPVRSPDFCNDCPLVPLFVALKGIKLPVFTDLGCGAYSGGFLASGEVSVASPLGAAISFSEKEECVCVINEDSLLKNVELLPRLSDKLKLIVLTSRTHSYARELFSTFGISVEKLTLEGESVSNLLIRNGCVCLIDKMECKYEL